MDRSLRFKGLFKADINNNLGFKIYEIPDANLPDVITIEMMVGFYKYDSGNKTFKEISGIKSLSASTDACVISKKKKSLLSK